MSDYDELVDEICEGCDGRGQCHDLPCVTERMDEMDKAEVTA